MSETTFLSYNIKSGSSGGIRGLAAAMRPVDADVVGLQEVDRGTVRSGDADQAAELASALGLQHAVFGPAVPWPGGGEYGVALLSRFSLEDVRTLALFVPDGADVPESLREPRLALSATVRPPRGKPFRVFVTHFGLAPEQRSIQARELAAAVQQAAVHGATIVLGDLNAEPGAQELAPLFRELQDAHAALDPLDRLTFPAAARPPNGIAIDYVLASADVHVTRAEVVKDVAEASDHDLCVARLAL